MQIACQDVGVVPAFPVPDHPRFLANVQLSAVGVAAGIGAIIPV